MSAQERKDAGKTAPVAPQRPEGGFSRFLRRFFVPQLPPELKDFAVNLNQRVDNHLASQRQKELDLRRENAARMATTTAENERVAGEERNRAEQFKAREREALKILQDFQIAEKLKYIQRTAWEGMGRIKPVKEESSGTFSGSDFQYTVGGLELMHQYPGCHRISITTAYGGEMDSTITKFVSDTRFTKLAIKVIHIKHDSGESDYALRILSGVESSSPSEYVISYPNPSNILEMDIPIKAKDSVALLDQVLVQETDLRLSRGLSPRELEQKAGNELAESKRKSY